MFDKVNLLKQPTMQGINKNHPIPDENKSNFKQIFKNAIEKVSKVENEADLQQQSLVNGKVDDLHQVMIATQKATITIEAAVQIQQKVIDAYNEVMRMQV